MPLIAAAIAVVVWGPWEEEERFSTRTDHGIRWELDGAEVVITVTRDVPEATRARLSGRLVVGCQRSGSLGALDVAGLGLGSLRFSAVPQTVRVRVSPRPRQIDTCFLERPGVADDISVVRFSPDPPPDGDGEMLIIR